MVRIVILSLLLVTHTACSFARIVFDDRNVPSVLSVVGDSAVEANAIASGLRLEGTNLDGVTSVRLVDPPPGTGSIELAILDQTSISILLSLSAVVALVGSDEPYTLEVLSSREDTQVVVQRVPVQLLRGSTGPTGDQGAAGSPGLAGTSAQQIDFSCSPPQLVRSVSPLGVVTCALFTGSVQPTDGAARPHRNYAIHPIDFRPMGAEPWAYDGLAIFRDATVNQALEVRAAVHLPQGATIVDYACRYVDNDASNDLSIQLQRKLGTSDVACGSGITSSGSSASALVLSATPGACSGLVTHDSSSGPDGVYFLSLTTQSKANAVALHGCSVRFSVASALP